MRLPSALSFTSLKAISEDIEAYYMARLTDHAAGREPQTRPMAVGSCFDAWVKSALYRDVFGTVTPEFELASLYEKQVEPQHRDWAMDAGDHVFRSYILSGSYHDLRGLLMQSDESPRFEFEKRETVDGVPFVGRPDLWFVLNKIAIVLDWKVRGFFSKASPGKGYRLCRDGWSESQHSRSHGKTHKGYIPMNFSGFEVCSFGLEETNTDYAAQTSIYAWLMGHKPGDEEWAAVIEELCGCGKDFDPPHIRVAQHRGMVSHAYQMQVFDFAKKVWDAFSQGHVFYNLSRADSDEKCALLDEVVRRRGEMLSVSSVSEQLARINETYGQAA